MAAGIDPAECGFSMDQSTFDRAPRVIRNADTILIAFYWKPLQQTISDVIKLDNYGARRFFEWFKTVDLNSMGRPNRSLLLKLFYSSPYPIARTWTWCKVGAARLRLSTRVNTADDRAKDSNNGVPNSGVPPVCQQSLASNASQNEVNVSYLIDDSL